MMTHRILFTVSLWIASGAATAAEREALLFHAGVPGPALASVLPGTAWGPGSIVSSQAVMGRLFPPTLIMQQQSSLDLTAEQQESIKQLLRDFQSQVVDVQWDLQASQGTLEAVLAEDRINPDAAEAAIDRVLDAENALKRLHLNMLIRIRNVLSTGQIEKLESASAWGGGGLRWRLPEPPRPPEVPEP